MAKIPLEPVMTLYDVLQQDSRFFTVGVNDATFYGVDGGTSRSLIVTVWNKGRVREENREELVTSIVKTVLENEKNIDQYDGIQIKLTSAYDIGIATGHLTQSFSDSIDGWRKSLRK